MKNVAVITGGGSGMGLATAKFMDKEKIIILTGRTAAKLEKACDELKALGFDARYQICDTSDRNSVKALANYAASLGEIKNVINAAGISPAMGAPDKILRINALGTKYVNQEFAKLMKPGSVIVDIASNSAYALPGGIFKLFRPVYKLVDKHEGMFVGFFMTLCKLLPSDYYKSGMAYTFSKNFTLWYAAKSAFEFGPKGIRVCSLSPGLIATDMGNLEKESGGQLIGVSCEERMGKPEELGFAIASVADERNGYLAAVDILCDGGSTRGNSEFKASIKGKLQLIGLIK